jgi:hypothetical protein
VLFPFEDDKKLEDYSAEDFEELLEANFEQYTNKMGQEVAGQFQKEVRKKQLGHI